MHNSRTTPVIRDDDSFTIKLDNNELTSGSLTSDEDFVKGVNPPKVIDDPEDEKPEDWVDEPYVWDSMALRDMFSAAY